MKLGGGKVNTEMTTPDVFVSVAGQSSLEERPVILPGQIEARVKGGHQDKLKEVLDDYQKNHMNGMSEAQIYN